MASVEMMETVGQGMGQGSMTEIDQSIWAREWGQEKGHWRLEHAVEVGLKAGVAAD